MTRRLLAMTTAALALAGTSAFAVPDAPGIFDAPSPLPLHAPQFDKIKDGDFQPALETGMARQRAEIDKIANDPAKPTFDNTIVAMERSGQMLDRVAAIFFGLSGANTNPTLQHIQEVEAPKLAAHRDAIYLDPKLFARVQAVYDTRAAAGLNAEQKQLAKVTYDEFVHSGAKLSAADQTRLRAINERLSSLSTEFDRKLLAATKAGALTVTDPARLAGLGQPGVEAAAQAAKGRGVAGYVVPLQNTTQQPALQSLTDRPTRE